MAIDRRSDLAAALLVERLVRDAYSDRGPGSITPLQWALLRALGRARDSAYTQSWLARFVGVTAAPASRSLRALERHGAVESKRDPQDGRQVLVSLTPRGRELLEEDPILAISARIARLDDAEKVAFRGALQHLFMSASVSG